jgi:filamentous hemagglutinin
VAGATARGAAEVPVAPGASAAPKIGAKTWQQYEKGVQGLYGEASFSARQYTAVVDGKLVNGVADNVAEIAGKRVAVEAKFVEDWAKSLRNPASPIGSKPFAVAEQAKMLDQAKKYSAAFDEVIYHSNSPELIAHYTKVFQNAGIKNFRFILTE